MSRKTHSYVPQTEEAIQLLGLEIARARREQRWTAKELATRVGVSLDTLRKVERGDPTVGIGTFFEAAVIVGIDLFGVDEHDLEGLLRQSRSQLALLPTYVRGSETVDDDF